MIVERKIGIFPGMVTRVTLALGMLCVGFVSRVHAQEQELQFQSRIEIVCDSYIFQDENTGEETVDFHPILIIEGRNVSPAVDYVVTKVSDISRGRSVFNGISIFEGRYLQLDHRNVRAPDGQELPLIPGSRIRAEVFGDSGGVLDDVYLQVPACLATSS